MKIFWGVMLQAGKSQLRGPETSSGPVSGKGDMLASQVREGRVCGIRVERSQELPVVIFRFTLKWQGRAVCSWF